MYMPKTTQARERSSHARLFATHPRAINVVFRRSETQNPAITTHHRMCLPRRDSKIPKPQNSLFFKIVARQPAWSRPKHASLQHKNSPAPQAHGEHEITVRIDRCLAVSFRYLSLLVYCKLHLPPMGILAIIVSEVSRLLGQQHS